MEERHRGEVEGVAGVRLERPDAPLAEDDVGVARRDDVLGGHEELLDRRPEAALEHDRPGDPAGRVEERVVLHVPGADLEDVDVLGDDVDLVRLHDLGDRRQAGPVARLGEVAKGLHAQALEGVRRGPRLEGAAAEDRRPGRRHRVRRLHELVAALDRAGARHHRQPAVADDRVEDPDDGVLRMELARGQLEGPRDRGDRLDAGQRGETARQDLLEGPDLADDRDHDALLAGVVVGRHPLGEDVALDPEDLGLGRGAGHDDEHRAPFLGTAGAETKKQRSPPLLRPARRVPPASDAGNDHAGSVNQ